MLRCIICHELMTDDEALYDIRDWYREEPMCWECAPSNWKEIEGTVIIDDIESEEEEDE